MGFIESFSVIKLLKSIPDSSVDNFVKRVDFELQDEKRIYTNRPTKK